MKIICCIIGYIFGSISISVTVSTLFLGGDIREKGSGNAGATNMARIYGWGAGALTLVADMLKTLAAMWLGKILSGDVGFACAGVGCMVGHCWPIFYKFKGGKGVSAGAMVALMIDWRVFIAVIAAFLVFALASKKVSLGSVMAAVTLSVMTAVLSLGTAQLILAICSSTICICRHSENIKRLINGTEPVFRAANK